MSTPQEKALKGSLIGKLKGLQSTKDFGVKKGQRREIKKRSKMKGEELF